MYQIGKWRFDPGAHELRSPEQVTRLEHRASAVLAMLCERRGETVSQAEMLDRVWAGRHVSANSVPVVIGNLRRALGDPARQPEYLQTVAKRGYRLIAEDGAEDVVPRRRPLVAWAFAAAAVLALGIGLYLFLAPSGAKLVVEQARNETGDPRYESLAKAVRATMIAQLSARDVAMADGDTPGQDGLRMRIKLVLWNQKPEIAMEALDPATGKIRWTGTVFVPENRIPYELAKLARDFAQSDAGRHDSAPGFLR